MRVVAVDFAPPRSVRLLAALLVILGALGVMAFQGWRIVKVNRDLQSLTSRAYETRSRVEPMDAKIASKYPAFQGDLKALAAWASFDSARVLRTVESVREPGVRVNVLRIEARKGDVHLEVESSGHDLLLRYVDALNGGEPQPSWRLLRTRVQGTGEQAVVGEIAFTQ